MIGIAMALEASKKFFFTLIDTAKSHFYLVLVMMIVSATVATAVATREVKEVKSEISIRLDKSDTLVVRQFKELNSSIHELKNAIISGKI